MLNSASPGMGVPSGSSAGRYVSSRAQSIARRVKLAGPALTTDDPSRLAVGKHLHPDPDHDVTELVVAGPAALPVGVGEPGLACLRLHAAAARAGAGSAAGSPASPAGPLSRRGVQVSIVGVTGLLGLGQLRRLLDGRRGRLLRHGRWDDLRGDDLPPKGLPARGTGRPRGRASGGVVHRDLLDRQLEHHPHRWPCWLRVSSVGADRLADDQGVQRDDQEERPEEAASWLADLEQTRSVRAPRHGSRTLAESDEQPKAHDWYIRPGRARPDRSSRFRDKDRGRGGPPSRRRRRAPDTSLSR